MSGLPPFQSFLDEHCGEVWRFLVAAVGPLDAEDCYQETLIAALRAYPGLAASRREHNLRAWLLTIAQRKAIDLHRARARRALPVADPAEHAREAAARGGAYGREPAMAGPAGECEQALWDAVGELPERQRCAVVLRFVSDLAHRDVAAALGCSEEAARRSLHEGLAKLRKAVQA